MKFFAVLILVVILMGLIGQILPDYNYSIYYIMMDTGGTTSLVDAFKCAEILKQNTRKVMKFCRIPVPAHSAGEEKVCI